jgi:hypothetical protein
MDTCEKCNGKLCSKDHGTWIGWYCPTCKTGGSIGKDVVNRTNTRAWNAEKDERRDRIQQGFKVIIGRTIYRAGSLKEEIKCATFIEAENTALARQGKGLLVTIVPFGYGEGAWCVRWKQQNVAGADNDRFPTEELARQWARYLATKVEKVSWVELRNGDSLVSDWQSKWFKYYGDWGD